MPLRSKGLKLECHIVCHTDWLSGHIVQCKKNHVTSGAGLHVGKGKG